MQKNMTKPKKSVIENDEFFYRHPEMFRTKLDEEEDLDDTITTQNENFENHK